MKINFNFELSEKELQIISEVIGSRSRHNDSRPRHNGNRARVLYGGNRSDSDKKCFERESAVTDRKITADEKKAEERLESVIEEFGRNLDRMLAEAKKSLAADRMAEAKKSLAADRMADAKKSLAITQHRSIDDGELY